MELDELKNIWQSQSAKLAEKEIVQESELSDLLRGKANDLISLITRSVLFEYYFTIATLIVCLIVFPFTNNIMVKITTGTLVLIAVPFIFIYRNQLKTLGSIFPHGENVKDELKALLKKFNQYLRFYSISYRVLIPFALVVGLFMGGQASSGGDWYKVFNSPVVAILIVMVLIGFIYGMDKAIGWYLKRLYGDYLSHLEKVIKELEE